MSFVYPKAGRQLAVVIGLGLPMTHVTIAFAQGSGGNPANPGGSTSGSGVPSGGGGGGGGGGTGTVSTQTTTIFPGGVAPPPPGANIGGGNAQFSSSKPISGSERDSFDFKRGGSTSTARGGENSSFVLGEKGPGFGAPTSNNGIHVVRRGDTLWDICDHYFRNPYQWPRVWSFNPQIQNPHWIFPGDQVRLRGGELLQPQQTAQTGSQLIDRRRQVPPETIFLRTQGFIEEGESNNWGEVSGSPEEKMILTDNDEMYLKIGSDHDLKVGQELTIYRPIKSVGGGKMIEIQGTARVNQWNPKDRIARAKIVEALDAIERGARVGPVARRFEVVPPLRNDKEVDAKVLTSVQPQHIFGQNQVVFIDKGEEAGLKPGNVLRIIRKGDGWHDTQTTTSSSKRIALEDESPAATENVPKPRSSAKLPEEVIAELRVINVKKHTAMTIVTNSKQEIEIGDHAFARKGF